MHRTPSLEDSDYSSSAATVNARVIDDQDDATSPPPTSARIDTAPSSSAPPNPDADPASSPTPSGNEQRLYVFKRFWSLLTKGGEAYELIVFKRVHMGGCFIFCFVLTTLVLLHLVL